MVPVTSHDLQDEIAEMVPVTSHDLQGETAEMVPVTCHDLQGETLLCVMFRTEGLAVGSHAAAFCHLSLS